MEKYDTTTICLKMQKEYCIIQIKEIVFCKAEGSYSIIYFDGGSQLVASKSLIALEKLFNNQCFIRCHNSYLINFKKIKKYNSRNRLLHLIGHEIPISKRKHHLIIQRLKSM